MWVGVFNMTLNGTLIAQAINFGIAYCLLRWLYFKPAIAQIQQENADVAHINNSMVERCVIIAQKQQQQQMHWQKCQEYCKEHAPSMQKPDLFAPKDGYVVEQPMIYDDATLEKLTNDVTNMLVQRIEHVS